MRTPLLLFGITLLLASSTSPTAAAKTCVSPDACVAWVEVTVPPGDCMGLEASGLVCGADDVVGPLVRVGPGEGDCSGPITWGGPVACNLMTQFLCDDAYNDECDDEARMCRGPDGHLRSDMDGDRDGQCDNADVDDDNDGVPDECDDHPNNQDIVQETIDYVDYYVFEGSHC